MPGKTNYRVLRRQIVSQSAKVVAQAEPYLEKALETKRKAFLRAFDESEVSKEIRRGPSYTSSMLGYGNLYSFLGFEEGEHPVSALRAWLKSQINFSKGKSRVEAKGDALYIRRSVTIPTVDEVHAKANQLNPLKWAAGRGWTDLVEKGITGWARFLSVIDSESDRKRRHRIESSRSGTAIQVHTKNLRSGKVGRIEYIRPLLASLRASISSNRK